jgi:gluconate kinase
MSIQREIFLNENGTRVYLKECKKHGLTEYYASNKKCIECSKIKSSKRDFKQERKDKKK